MVTMSLGGTEVTVSADTRTDASDGYLGGWVTATAGDLTVRTPVAVHKEIESYDLTVRPTDRTGDTPGFFGLNVTSHGGVTVVATAFSPVDGARTFRLPRGHYTVVGTVEEKRENPKDRPVITLLAQPDLSVDRASTPDLDARTGRPISVTVPRKDARQLIAELGAGTDRGGTTLFGDDFSTMFAGRLGGDTDPGVAVAGDFAEQDADGAWVQSNQSSTYTSYRSGRSYRELWNRGVFSPAAATVPADPWAGVGRAGDTMVVALSPLTDGAGLRAYRYA